MKPSDRVLSYLHRELGAEALKQGARLPTTRKISSEIQVSPGTVRNVFQKLAAEGRIEIRPGSGAFWIAEANGEKKELLLGINARQVLEAGSADQWSYKIYGGITKRALESDVPLRLKLVPFERAIDSRKDDIKAIEEEVGQLDGCLLFPFPGVQGVASFLEQHQVPCINYNPATREGTSNFVSPDYFGATQKIGRIWQQTGRRRILVLLAPGTTQSVSCELAYAGLVSGLGMEADVLPQVQKLTVPSHQRALAEKAFRQFLSESSWVPDAVFCMTDELALGAIAAAEQKGIRIPEEMSLIGGNGVSSYEPRARLVTAAMQPLEQIGEDLMTLILKRIATRKEPVPGILRRMPFLLGATTRPSENLLLET